MNDPLWEGPRNVAWRVDLLDLSNQLIQRSIDGVGRAEYEASVGNEITSGGNLEYSGDPLTWNKVQLQPWYMLMDDDDKTVLAEMPVGVFVPSTPKRGFDSGGRIRDIELYDRTVYLVKDVVTSPLSLTKGSNPYTFVTNLLTSANMAPFYIEPPETTLVWARDITWEPDTTLLKVVNEVLEGMEYFSLRADGRGVVRSSPYVSPSRRGSVWDFIDNEKSVYTPEFTLEEDLFEIPNRVILRTPSDSESNEMEAIATNTNADSEYSYSGRGNHWFTRVEEASAANQAALNARAQFRLNELTNPSFFAEIKTDILPLSINDVVTFQNARSETSIRSVVRKTKISNQLDSEMEVRLMRVVE